MVGYDFSYNGKCLRDFDFIMAGVDVDDNSGLSRELLKGNVNSFRKEANHYGAKYTDVIILNFFITKDVCKNSDAEITYPEIRAIQSWITSTEVPYPLYVEFRDGNVIEYHGVFTDISPYVFNRLNGFKLTFTCNSPFAYKTKKIKVNVNGTSVSKRIVCDTDENDFIYPKIIITNVTNGIFKIYNKTEDKEMCFNLDEKYSKYIIDCKLKRILADNKILILSDIIAGSDSVPNRNSVNDIYKMYWFRLLPKMNEIIFSGQADCLIECKLPIKLGGFVYV